MNLLADFRVEAALTLLALGTLVLGALNKVSTRSLGHGLAGAVFALFLYLVWFQDALIGAGTATSMYRLDSMALAFKELCLLSAAGAMVVAAESERFGKTTCEHYVLLLLGTVGALVASCARDFLPLFVALELLTTASCVLVGFARRDGKAVEAGVKYLTVAALSTAFLAYGISFVFGAAGSTSYEAVHNVLASPTHGGAAALVGMTFVLTAVAFKLAVFPGHMWTADVYEGTPLPVTAFLAVASKCAGFAVLMRLLLDAFQPLQGKWAPVILVIAAVTILWGNLGALQQKDLKRLLGYSSMAQSGYLLFGTVAMSAGGTEAVLFYLVQYLFATLAFFLVLAALAQNGIGSSVEDLRGLSQRAPLLSWTLLAALLSMAGIPPLSGFLAKYMLFSAVPEYAGYPVLYFASLGLSLLGVVISAFYYLGVIRMMWAESPEQRSYAVGRRLLVPITACGLAMLVLGVYQEPVLKLASKASLSMGLH
jgi:NADH-quinone oxidoreductase subunit N